jgi:LysM repeat protein
MKFKSLLFAVLLFPISISLFAKPTFPDSVGVKNDDGKRVIVFKVKPKDTYSSIARRYNTTAKAIMKYNGSKKEVLAIGAIVNVPTDKPFKKSATSKKANDETVKETKKEKNARLAREAKAAKHKHKEAAADYEAPVVAQQPPSENTTQQPKQPEQQPVQDNNTPPTEYKVSAGETLYAISKRFNTTVDDITKLNNLTSTTLIPGQILMIRYGMPAPQPSPPVIHNDTQAIVARRDSTLVAPLKDSSTERRFSANHFGLYEKTEKGVATWIDDSSLDPNKKLVLHRTALIGTVIKITNPMTNRTTFAKVVGRFTDNEQTKDVIIVMTKNVADSLGALDKRFHVNISYGSPNE